MVGAWILLVISALAVLTIPADLPGTAQSGALMIVNLQGMCFCGVVFVRGIWRTVRNREMIRQFFGW